MDDEKFPQRGVMAKKSNSLNIKRQYKKLEQLASYHTKFLKDDFSKNGGEKNCDIYLQHHLIKMHIQSYKNTMNHYLTPTPDYHIKLMK